MRQTDGRTDGQVSYGGPLGQSHNTETQCHCYIFTKYWPILFFLRRCTRQSTEFAMKRSTKYTLNALWHIDATELTCPVRAPHSVLMLVAVLRVFYGMRK